MQEHSLDPFSDADIKEDIARRISYWRVQAKLSKADLARKINKSRGEIGRWESGEIMPGIVPVYRLASACGVSLAIYLSAKIPAQDQW
jgi:transcriptional regulator with XRE-family HTH domain